MYEIKAWSYSSIKKYNTCPKQFFHVKVVKDCEDPKTDATDYGKEFHEAAEFYIRDGVALPPQFAFVKEALDKLNAYSGEKHCEFKMGLTANLEPCDFFAKDVWWRGVADLLIIDGTEARCIDYKTGKSAKYADMDQLELMAMAIFKHFPQVEVVRGGLLFVLAKAFPKAKYHIENEGKMWEKWLSEYKRMEMSHKTGVFNPKPSGLCIKHCPVLSCPHNGRN